MTTGAGFAAPIITWMYQGAVAASGSMYVYQTGTTTLVSIYSDAGLTTPLSNPINLDSNGQAVFYVSGSVNLRLDGYTGLAGAGTLIKSIDPVYPVGTASGFTTEATLASATTTDLGSTSSSLIDITGTTTITGFGSSASLTAPLYFLRFTGALTLTYSATKMILPGSANITTAAGDTCVAQYMGSGNWKVLSYSPISGKAVVAPAQTAITYNSIAGCPISSLAGTHTTASATIGTGQCADSTNAAYITSAGYSWAASNGNAINGTDAASSTLANSTTYHMFLCSGGSGTGTFCSASLTPTFPTGYATYSRRIGSFKTDSSGNPLTYTSIEINGGGTINWLGTQTLDINTSTLGTSRTAFTLNVPGGIKVQPLVRYSTTNTTGTIILTSGDETDVAPAAAGASGGFTNAAPGADIMSVASGGLDAWISSHSILTTNTSAQIGARGSTTSLSLYLVTSGWVDFRRS